MNLRQKCKKLKQENERLKQAATVSMPIFDSSSDDRVITLGGKRMIPSFELRELPYGYIEKSIAHEMVDAIYPHMRFDRYIDGFSGKTVIEGSLNIVKPN